MTCKRPPWEHEDAVLELAEEELTAEYFRDLRSKNGENEAIRAWHERSDFKPLREWLTDPDRKGLLGDEAATLIQKKLAGKLKKATRGPPASSDEERQKRNAVYCVFTEYEAYFRYFKRKYSDQTKKACRERAIDCALIDEDLWADPKQRVSREQLVAFIADPNKSERDVARRKRSRST